MMYDTIFAKSFSRHEQKKLGYGAIVGCLLIVLSLCTVFKPYLGPIHDVNLKLSLSVNNKLWMLHDTGSWWQIAKVQNNATKKVEPLCTSEARTEFCEIQGDIRVHGKSSSVYIVSPKETILSEKNMAWTIRPYARKDDEIAMSLARKWSVKPVRGAGKEIARCTENHSVPAVIFSTGGYVGNHFHEFSDIIIPLFLTSRRFDGEVKFLVTDTRPWWIWKHQAIIKNLSKYEVMDIDRDDGVHCFPSVNVGLKRYQKELSIDPEKYPYSMKDFRDFLRSSYSLKRVQAIKIREIGVHKKKPKLLIVSRKKSRSFTNIAEIAKMAKRLGFKVMIMEASGNMSSFADIVNSCDVLLGVHGAGLTNILFLPENAVLIQVVPYGGLEWLAKTDFGLPSKDMSLNYLEYRIKLEESTLIQQYPMDHTVIKDPPSIEKLGWQPYKSVYLDQQNVKLDVNRFRPTLQKALEMLHQ